jgi:hypothetical protein
VAHARERNARGRAPSAAIRPAPAVDDIVDALAH